MKPTTARLLLTTALAFLYSPGTWAHSEHEHGAMQMETGKSSSKHAIGKPGDIRKATRTVTIDMLDSMRFGPSEMIVRQGETVRIIVVNKGVLPHELVLGTKEGLKAHAEAMRKNPHGAHDDPGAVRVEPGHRKEFAWQFTNAGSVDFGCLLPGHFEAGMVGKVKVAGS